MKPNPNSDSSSRNPGNSPQSPQPGNYSPTVPLSVYRELTAELQATKAMLDSLHAQNQQLTRQNTQLRQEVERVIQSAINLQQIVNPQPYPGTTGYPQTNADLLAEQVRSVAARPNNRQRPPEPDTAPAPNAHFVEADLLSNQLFTEQPMHSPRRSSAGSAKDLNGLWLWLTVLAIIITAFGAGFLVVRPLLPSR